MKARGSVVTIECTGREVYAYDGILGIVADARSSALFGGYDHEVTLYHADLTAEERREIAEHMVARWQEWGRMESEG